MSRKSTHNHRVSPYGDAITTPQFFAEASREKSLSHLSDLFVSNIKAMHGRNYLCSRIVLEKYAAPLFGNGSDHAAEISNFLTTRTESRKYQIRIQTSSFENDLIIGFPVNLAMGDPLILSIGFNRHVYDLIDADSQSKLATMATIYAMKALPLWEVEADFATASPLTLMERKVLAMMLTGASRFEISSSLDRSIAAVAVHIDRAINKLGGRDEADAVAIAARHGWLHFPHGFGIVKKH